MLIFDETDLTCPNFHTQLENTALGNLRHFLQKADNYFDLNTDITTENAALHEDVTRAAELSLVLTFCINSTRA